LGCRQDVIALNRFKRFEYEDREAEYDKAELSPSKMPEEPIKF
jgi:hypothetical protein